MRLRFAFVAALLFCSGWSALVLQTAWFREFRLVFGTTTAASAAVLAVFMGGLGFGQLFWGPRIDRDHAPLRIYARLETWMAISAALGPWLLDVVREAYVLSGGRTALGVAGVAAVRAALALLVLGPPTFLMGGTLPAAGRVAVLPGDEGRRGLGWLYAANTLGAVAGVAAATFVLLERLGTRWTLWTACGVALAVAVTAAVAARKRRFDVDPHDEPVRYVMHARRTTRSLPVACAATASPGGAAHATVPALEPVSAVASAAVVAADRPSAPAFAAQRATALAATSVPLFGPATSDPLVSGSAATPAENAKGGSLPQIDDSCEAVGGFAAGTACDRAARIETWATWFAAGLVGAVFFLMELVWARMLGPLLGGTTYTFGAVLATALFGIGAGAAAYGLSARGRRATLGGVALTCAAEALCLVVPYALGDRVALLAAGCRSLESFGFAGQVGGWLLVTGCVVLPAAIVAGWQFPQLVSVLGEGRRRLGRDVGTTCACNTVGAIGGCLAGGFGMIPLLTAPGAWRTAAGVLAVLAIVLLVADAAARGGVALRLGRTRALATFATVGATILCAVLATGPTSVWRHGGIGVGRLALREASPNGYRSLLQDSRLMFRWEADGRESSLAVASSNGYAVFVNGKADGHAIGDAGTQIMLGLLGAVLHREPRTAFVVGLGTGQSAGWLAAVPSIERVDVVELEPRMRHMAELCGATNRRVLDDPRVRLSIADAREFLTTNVAEYDLIASEPSNPYRAGVADLFTREFYAACRRRLRRDGLFVQWLQGYEIDDATVRTVLATLRSVFPHVEIWQGNALDLLLVCSDGGVDWDGGRLMERLRREPYAEGLRRAWGANDMETFVARYVAGPALADRVAEAAGGRLATDDRNPVEYASARLVGANPPPVPARLRRFAVAAGLHRPPLPDAYVSWELVEDARLLIHSGPFEPDPDLADAAPGPRTRAAAIRAYARGDFAETLAAWNRQTRPPRFPHELLMLAHAAVELRSDDAAERVRELEPVRPAEARFLQIVLFDRTGAHDAASDRLAEWFDERRTDPWVDPKILAQSLSFAILLAGTSPPNAAQMYEVLQVPFAVHVADAERIRTVVQIATRLSVKHVVAAFDEYGPGVPWVPEILRLRRDAYRSVADPRLGEAESDLAACLAGLPEPAFRTEP